MSNQGTTRTAGGGAAEATADRDTQSVMINNFDTEAFGALQSKLRTSNGPFTRATAPYLCVMLSGRSRWTVRDIAGFLGYTEPEVTGWLNAYNTGGLGGLAAQHG